MGTVQVDRCGWKACERPFFGPTAGRCASYTSIDPFSFASHLSHLTIQIVTLNMEAVGSPEASENMSTTRRILKIITAKYQRITAFL